MTKFLSITAIALSLFAFTGCKGEPAAEVESSNILNYSEENLEIAKQKGTPLLYFYADWCPTCRTLNQELAATPEQIPEQVTILKINYDTADELKNDYEIVQQHTLIQLDSNGEEVKRWIGGGLSTIVSQLEL